MQPLRPCKRSLLSVHAVHECLGGTGSSYPSQARCAGKRGGIDGKAMLHTVNVF